MGIRLKVDGVTDASQGAMSCQQGQETRSVVERIAAFADAARPKHLTPDVRGLFKRNILDSLACAIAALPGRPFAALRGGFPTSTPRWRWIDVDAKLSRQVEEPVVDPFIVGAGRLRDGASPHGNDHST